MSNMLSDSRSSQTADLYCDIKTLLLHSPAPPPIPKISSHIRSVLHEAALGLGMTENRPRNRTFRIERVLPIS